MCIRDSVRPARRCSSTQRCPRCRIQRAGAPRVGGSRDGPQMSARPHWEERPPGRGRGGRH
eukprot:5632208-Alexandrium_andersonii.AAC.1